MAQVTKAYEKEVKKEKTGLKPGEPLGYAYARATKYFQAHHKKIYVKG